MSHEKFYFVLKNIKLKKIKNNNTNNNNNLKKKLKEKGKKCSVHGQSMVGSWSVHGGFRVGSGWVQGGFMVGSGQFWWVCVLVSTKKRI